MENMLLGALLMLILVVFSLYWIRRRVDKKVQELIVAIKQAEAQSVVLLSVEEINGVIYGWNLRNEEFVCQGRTIKELQSSFAARYPTLSAAVAYGPEDLMRRLRQESKTHGQLQDEGQPT